MARGTMWAGAIAALGITGLVWLAWPASPVVGGPAAGARHTPAPDRAGERDDPGAHARGLGGARFIEVSVTACKREAGVGVEVIAERGGLTYAARAGDSGLARIDVEGDGDVTVRARIGSFRTEPLAVDGARAAITACPGATVHGIVRDGSGTPEPSRVVQLMDAAGQVIDWIETDEDGAYVVSDPMLDGATLVVTSDGVDEEAVRGLRQLAPREDRELDLIVGDVRTVVGWVLDLDGEPQPGVMVTASAEAFGSRWLAFTDASGGFSFEGVPAASLRVEANGGDLGQAAARVAESEAKRREVSLTLEPTAHITVVGSELAGKVVVRCWDTRFHGPDGLNGPIAQIGVAHEYYRDDDSVYDAGFDQPAEHDDGYVAESGVPDTNRMMTVFEDALRTYDSTDPEGSVVRVIQSIMTELPEMRRSFDEEEGPMPEDPAAQEAFLRELVAEEFRKNPEQFEMFARLAAEVQQGKTLLEASQAAYGGWEEPDAAYAEDVDAPQAVNTDDTVVLEPADPNPYEVDEIAVDEGAVIDDSGELVYPDYVDGNGDVLLDPEGAEPLEVAGWPSTMEQRSQAATGAIGDAIAVRASFQYEVVVRGDDGSETYVGTVFVNPGDDLVLTVGQTAAMHIGGRVVDVDGRPIRGVEVHAAGTLTPASSGDDGRFELTVDASMASTWDVLLIDPASRYETTTRRNVTLLAGGARDLGTIVMRTAEEEPPGQMYQPYGGIGGLVSLDALGVRLVDVEKGCPLEMSGIESGDTITTIDGVPAAELPMNELLLRLRGEAGTSVELRVRTDSGELYDVNVLRDTIQPRSSWEPAYDFEEPQILLE